VASRRGRSYEVVLGNRDVKGSIARRERRTTCRPETTQSGQNTGRATRSSAVHPEHVVCAVARMHSAIRFRTKIVVALQSCSGSLIANPPLSADDQGFQVRRQKVLRQTRNQSSQQTRTKAIATSRPALKSAKAWLSAVIRRLRARPNLLSRGSRRSAAGLRTGRAGWRAASWMERSRNVPLIAYVQRTACRESG